eukprot:202792_1
MNMHHYVPGQIEEQYDFNTAYLVNHEDCDCIEEIHLVQDEYEARMGYETEQEAYSDKELEEIAATQSIETVHQAQKKPIYLNIFGTLNTNEECEIETVHQA